MFGKCPTRSVMGSAKALLPGISIKKVAAATAAQAN
jgi:hypothetical protein